jgi:hypothetical protein
MYSPHSKFKKKFVKTPTDSEGWITKRKHISVIGPTVAGTKISMYSAVTCSPDDDKKIKIEKKEIGPIVEGERISMYKATAKVKKDKKEKEESINNYAGNMVHLTMNREEYDLPGIPSYSHVVNRHKEWNTYDPRGNSRVKYELPNDHCPSCLCPLAYCCNKVFGPKCVDHTKTIIRNRKSNQACDLEEVSKIFRLVYSEVVYAKMIMNNTLFVMDFGSKHKNHIVPKCVSRSSLRDLLSKYRVDLAHEFELEYI